MFDYFEDHQRLLGEGSKALSITIAVLIFAVVLTITWRLVNYLFNRATYLRDSIRGGMKWLIIGLLIFFLLIGLLLIIINILGKYQIDKEVKNETKESKEGKELV